MYFQQLKKYSFITYYIGYLNIMLVQKVFFSGFALNGYVLGL